MLKQRVLTSLWYVPLGIVVVWFGRGPGFTILIAVLGILAAIEFYRMVANAKAPPLTYFGIIWTALFILSRDSGLLSQLAPHLNLSLVTPLLLTSAVVISLIGLLARQRREGALTSWVWTMAGILYIGWLLGHLVALRGLSNGRNWVFLVLFITWVSDTAAFFIGRRFGQHKLAPSISPGKTWEGAIGGVGGAIVMSLLFSTSTPFQLPLSYQQAIPLSILVSVFGQIGDLIESLIKRNMGVKDSSKLMPGHGGILDRIDSIILAGVVVYYYVIWTM
ncbi:MAG: phosphatidate cytidylyltransferase [Dehalococcoidales bacterium]|nr:phosphatidate cytidylyltransferase [Dehalococcoidales bacterium]